MLAWNWRGMNENFRLQGMTWLAIHQNFPMRPHSVSTTVLSTIVLGENPGMFSSGSGVFPLAQGKYHFSFCTVPTVGFY